jgi:hypothetical protein
MDAPPLFHAVLFRWPGKGGWTFAPVPDAHAPPVVAAWGRTPVIAVVDGHAYETSVWRDKVHGCLLPVPAQIRGAKAAGDPVEVQLRPRAEAPG